MNLRCARRQTIPCIVVEAFINSHPECLDAIDGSVAEIIDTDGKWHAQRQAEMIFDGLWCDFDLVETRLLGIAATIRGIPVAIIVLLPAGLPRHAPVCEFVQCTARVVVCEPDFGRFVCTESQVERFMKTANQTGTVG